MPKNPQDSVTLYHMAMQELCGWDAENMETTETELKDGNILLRHRDIETGKQILTVVVDKDRTIRMIVYPTLRLN